MKNQAIHQHPQWGQAPMMNTMGAMAQPGMSYGPPPMGPPMGAPPNMMAGMPNPMMGGNQMPGPMMGNPMGGMGKIAFFFFFFEVLFVSNL